MVKPGKKVKLSKYDPDETLGWEKDHKMKPASKSALRTLDELQYLLYAERNARF